MGWNGVGGVGTEWEWMGSGGVARGMKGKLWNRAHAGQEPGRDAIGIRRPHRGCSSRLVSTKTSIC